MCHIIHIMKTLKTPTTTNKINILIFNLNAKYLFGYINVCSNEAGQRVGEKEMEIPSIEVSGLSFFFLKTQPDPNMNETLSQKPEPAWTEKIQARSDPKPIVI